MGRRENPVNRSLRVNAQLALSLRRRRTAGGWSYEELAEQSPYSRQTLQRAAAGGMTVPSWPVVTSFVAASRAPHESDADLERAQKQAKSMWCKARYEMRRRTQPRRPAPPPRLGLVHDESDVGAVLVELYEQAGAPSMQTMEDLAGGMGILPHSTAYRIVNRKALPCSPEQFEGFLDACEVPQGRRKAWHQMWWRMFPYGAPNAYVDSVPRGRVVTTIRSPRADNGWSKLASFIAGREAAANYPGMTFEQWQRAGRPGRPRESV